MKFLISSFKMQQNRTDLYHIKISFLKKVLAFELKVFKRNAGFEPQRRWTVYVSFYYFSIGATKC